jgi:PRTRC genetic system protein A
MMSNPSQDPFLSAEMDLAVDPRDAALQAHTPTVMAPRYDDLERLQEYGHRYIVAENGLWVEALQPWIWTRMQVASSNARLPYGPMEPEMEHWLSIEDLDNLIRLFLHHAKSAMPFECAAIGVYNLHTQELELRPLGVIYASAAHVQYTRPVLAEHEALAVDLHSHGEGEAFFSAQDDLDDAGEVKLSIVVGRVHEYPDLDYMRKNVAARWCLHGLFEPAHYMVSR